MLSVLTFNIWFDELNRNERLFSLINVIQKNSPDIICLQEVIYETYEILKNILKEYTYFYPNKLELSYGCVIFSKHIMTQTYDKVYPETQMGRNLIAINIVYNSINITIATSHFESIFGLINTTKTSQYIHAMKLLNKLYDIGSPVIFCSDTNILPSEERYFFKDILWVDAYNEVNFDSHQEKQWNNYTYDTKHNTNLIKRNIKILPSRIDRIVYRGGSTLTVIKFKLVGKFQKDDIITNSIKEKTKYTFIDVEDIINKKVDIHMEQILIEQSNQKLEINTDIEPSDHFGVLVHFEITNNEIHI